MNADIEPYRLATGVSGAFWCKPKLEEPFYEFSPLRWPRLALTDAYGPICWLDRLFHGGIFVTKPKTRALTMLITGPPGTGKSILAQEMCYRLTLYPDYPYRPEGLYCLYVSTENSAERIITKVRSFDWERAGDKFQKYDESPGTPHVAVLGSDKIRSYIKSSQQPDLSLVVHRLAQKWKQVLRKNSKFSGRQIPSPDVLVIDSLNVIGPSNQADIFNQFMNVATNGPALVIFVMESDSGGQGHEHWGYVCDIILRLDRKYSQDYMLRSIEVVKARNQQHAWGQHQMKILQSPREALKHTAAGQMNPHDRLIQARRRSPYRDEGGIFIFPSIPYYLSIYKQDLPADDPLPVPFPLPPLNETINGLPAGRCTALIGTRGAHKSHIGYFHLLSRILKGEKAIVVSLRDDERMAQKTMSRILRQEFSQGSSGRDRPRRKKRGDDLCEETKRLEKFEMEGNLEVIYYTPGHIAPDEFFHRIFVSIQSMKSQGNQPLTVLFNSLDQLPARFPLCAKESIFVPALIQMLTAEKATCIFVAADEPGQPEEQYGLLQMADMILSLRPRLFYKKYYDWLLKPEQTRPKIERIRINPDSDPMVQAVVLYTVRIPGGKPAGARGMLELVDDGSPLRKAGLHFIPFPREFPVGDIVEF